MGVYDVIKDGVKVARDAGNVELSLKLAQVADDLLEKQKRISELEEENRKLKKKKEYKYAKDHGYMISPDNPSLKLCPTCLNRDGFENPMTDYDDGGYCKTCGKVAE